MRRDLVFFCVVLGLSSKAAVGQPNFAREQELAQMHSEIPLLVADFDPDLDTPTFIRSTAAFLTRRSQNTPQQIVADYINGHPGVFGVSFDGGSIVGGHEFSDASHRVLKNYVTASIGLRHLAYQQTLDGQDVYGCILTANVTSDGMLLNIGSRFVPNPASPATSNAPTCGAANAVGAACSAVNDARITDIVNLILPSADCTLDWKVGQSFAGVSDTALYVKSIIFPESRTTLSQAWLVRLPSNPDSDNAVFEVIVRQSDLSILQSADITMRFEQPDPATFKVYQDDSPIPGTPGLAAPTDRMDGDSECEQRMHLGLPNCPGSLGDSRALVTVTADDVLPWSPLGWLNEQHTTFCESTSTEVTQTCGNNVRVQINNATPPDFVTAVGSSRELIFSLNPQDIPTNYTNAALTQAFYDINWWHDRIFALGFDEEAGNFQESNFSGSGVGEDALLVHAFSSNVTGYGSANWLTGDANDGQRYLVKYSIEQTGPNLSTDKRASVLDRTAVFHELTHAMMARLAPSASVRPLYVGMQEGWADFFAIALTAKSTDDLTGNYPMFAWPARGHGATLNNYQHYYYGARRYPYSTKLFDQSCLVQINMNTSISLPRVNPLTLGYIDTTSSARTLHPDRPSNCIGGLNPNFSTDLFRGEPHAMGEVWCEALFECRAQLSLTLGFQANEIMMQLLIDSAKILNGEPDMVQARDAILQADLLRYGGEHQPDLWTAFANRGFGWGAVGHGSNAVRPFDGVVESFDSTPSDTDQNRNVAITFLDEPPLEIPTCTSTTLDVLVVGISHPVTSVRGSATSNAQGLFPSGQDAINLGNGRYRLILGPSQCRQAWKYWAEATVGDGSLGNPVVTRTTMKTVGAAGILSVVFDDDMENSSGWTTGLDAPWVLGSAPATGSFGNTPVDPVPWYNQPANDTTSGVGRLCWVTENHNPQNVSDINADDVDSDGRGVWLRSPSFALLPNTTAIVSFQQWYASQVKSGDSYNDIEAKLVFLKNSMPQNASEVDYRRLPPDPANPSDNWEFSARQWQHRLVSIPTADASGSSFALEFQFIDVNHSTDMNSIAYDTTVEGAIDDVVVYQISGCQECCDGDVNRDGLVDQGDVDYLIAVVAGGPNPQGSDPDFNHDGVADQGDIDALINYTAGGGCP